MDKAGSSFLGKGAMTGYSLDPQGLPLGLWFSIMDRPAPGAGLCGQPGRDGLAKRQPSGLGPEGQRVASRPPRSPGSPTLCHPRNISPSSVDFAFPTWLQCGLRAVVGMGQGG